MEQTRCLILDIAMPEMSGFDVQCELKHRRRQIPIVFITARKDQTTRLGVLEEGKGACLLKPFSDTALLQAMRAALAAN